MDNLKPLILGSDLGLCTSVIYSQCCSNLCHLKPPKGSILPGQSQEQVGRSPNFSVSLLPNFLGFPTGALTFQIHAKHQPKMSQKCF